MSSDYPLATFPCPGCQRLLHVKLIIPEQLVKCPTCSGTFPIPASASLTPATQSPVEQQQAPPNAAPPQSKAVPESESNMWDALSQLDTGPEQEQGLPSGKPKSPPEPGVLPDVDTTQQRLDRVRKRSILETALEGAILDSNKISQSINRGATPIKPDLREDVRDRILGREMDEAEDLPEE